jgi:hypothetical protein
MGILYFIESQPIDFILEGEEFHFKNLLEAEKAGFNAIELLCSLVESSREHLGGYADA